MLKLAASLALLCLVSADTLPTFEVTFHQKADGSCLILSTGRTQHNRLLSEETPVVFKSKAQSVLEGEDMVENGYIVSVLAIAQDLADREFDRFGCKRTERMSYTKAPNDEYREIIYSGPSSNRIDVVFMGDGYTLAEKEEMYDDLQRLTDDMWSGVTFRSFRELMNVWAVYRESAESGIGTYGTPRNTAYRLYREGTELRGVYCGNPTAARQACQITGPNACNFPSLIGHDDYYGGLGGEFTISTSSETTGTVVLRHEFGHNFGDVGEEYDGGQVYSGANFQASLTNLKWSHWLTEPNNVVAEPSEIVVQDYAWYLLAQGNYTINFSSTGTYDSWILRFSVSGCETAGSLVVTLDGVKLPWTTQGLLDRSFYEYYGGPLTAGKHVLVFSQGFPAVEDLPRQLCSVTMHEYEADYHFGAAFIGAYPVWRQGMRFAGYRPNHETCLMRNMTSDVFCVVDQENVWLQFLEVVDLIDDLTVEYSGTNAIVALSPVPLAQFRADPLPNETYKLTWTQNGSARNDLTDVYEWTLPRSGNTGTWIATLQLTTPEVRSDPNNLLRSTKTIIVN